MTNNHSILSSLTGDTLKASYFTALYYDNVIWMFQNPPPPTPLDRANSKLTFIYYNISHSSKRGGGIYQVRTKQKPAKYRCYKMFGRVRSKWSAVIIFYEWCI